MKIKLEIELEEFSGFGCLHQDGFSIEGEGLNFLTYCVTVPGFLPYIHVHQGPLAGKTFKTKPEAFKASLISAFLAGPENTTAAEPAPVAIGAQQSPSNSKP
jgi:hypothetical protein